MAAYAGTLQRFLLSAPTRVAEVQHQPFGYYYWQRMHLGADEAGLTQPTTSSRF